MNDALEASCTSVACEARGVDGRMYRLTVEGELGEHLGPAFAGMKLSNEGGNAVLTGRVRDQAELHGLMQRISDLGLSLVSASAVDEADKR